jgi:PAS domain S-box-containing protein
MSPQSFHTVKLPWEEAQRERSIKPAIIIRCQPSGQFAGTFISENVKAQLGYEPEEVLREPGFWIERIHPEDQAQVLNAVGKLPEEGFVSQEYRFRHKDGTYRWMRGEITLMRDASGKPLEGIVSWTDITERRLAEEQLRLSEERFRLAFENAPIGIDIFDHESQFLKVNDAFCKMIGYSAEELTKVGFLDITHPEDVERSRKFAQQLLRGEARSCKLEKRYITKTGETIWGRVSGAAILDRRGKILCGLGMIENITEQKLAEQAVRESEEQFRQMAENIQEVFWMTDNLMSQVLYVSPAFEQVWGRACSTAYENAASYADAIHPEDRERLADNFATLQKTGSFDAEYRIIRPDGSIRWIWDRSFPIRDSSGCIYRLAGIAQDITDRKEAEKRIRRLNEELEQRIAARTAQLAELNVTLQQSNEELVRASRLKSEFLASISHDLRTPLNAIRGFSDLLAEESCGPLNPKQRRFISHICGAAQHLLELVNDILDLSKIEAGRMELFLRDLSLTSAVEEVLAGIAPLAQVKQIRIENAVARDMEVYADHVRFKQILYNLLSNAVKFTQEGGKVRIESQAEDDWVCVSVSDNGIGIALEEQGVIFQEFQLGIASGKAEQSGTGLGLAITKRLVEKHGGQIQVESEPGKGSRFSFRVLKGGRSTNVGSQAGHS